MGYEHYLWRPPELDLERWREWVGDVRQILSELPASVPKTYYPLDGSPVTVRAPLVVTGPIGNEGRPQLNDGRVAFNGGGWADVEGQPQRLWGASFWVDRVYGPPEFDPPLPNDPFADLEPRPDERGWWCESYKTNQRPYDLPVTASLIRLAHRFPEGVQVSSDGGPEDWQAGLELCRQVFGHAELPFAVDGGPDAAGPDRLNDLLAKRDGGRLAPHEAGELRDLLDRDLEAGREAVPGDEAGRQMDDRAPAAGHEAEP
ncbi:MAG: hypothetical protein E6J41_10115 [Chloroflexi bacterium]|nr:MAG: hypothetical protein E6J41_10115 [Chloroflexota bacterium]